VTSQIRPPTFHFALIIARFAENETCEAAGEDDIGLRVTPLSPARSSAREAFPLDVDEAHGNLRDSPSGARRIPRARTRVALSTCLIPIRRAHRRFFLSPPSAPRAIERSTRPTF
jgi:hypothetical protein